MYTTVDNELLGLSTRLGKRRLFRHRIWAMPDSACPGWMQIQVMPGWLTRRPSGAVEHVQHLVCAAGEFSTLIDTLEEQHNVHLWVAPIKTPTSWPLTNRIWWGYTLHAKTLRHHAKLSDRVHLKAVA
ncbi:hypothetical protein ASF71_01095 [Deinococcus sp. Leaf326]|nr:hypothetical protein ASF71_01095 [Deinococcus sp. Leaf326]